MADFDQILSPGDVNGGIVNVVVEIPSGSKNKIEWNRDKEIMQLDRIEPSGEPASYGFIPQTLNEDGDELDAIIIADEPLPTGLFVESRIVGIMRFEDKGEVDDKIIVVPENGPNSIATISDIPAAKIDEITYYFNHCKDFEGPNLTQVKGWGEKSEAIEVVNRAIELWNNHKD